MYRDDPDDPEPPYGETPDRWKIIRAKILLRELHDLMRLDRKKDHPIDLKITADLAFLATEEVGAEDYWITWWCLKFIPDLSADQLSDLVDAAQPRFWYGDDIAKAFDITAAEREQFALSQVGACDDDDREKRDAYKRARNAAYNRMYRAKNSTGRKRGRPADPASKEKAKEKDREYQKEKRASAGKKRGRPKGIPEWQAAGFKSKSTYQRHKANGTLGQMAPKMRRRKYRETNESITIESIGKSHAINTDGISVPPITVTPASNVVFLTARSISISKAVTIPIDLRKAA
jgi:hypothetical protein